MIDTSHRRDWAFGVGITSWIVWSLAHLHVLDDPVLADEHKSLAPVTAESIFWSWVIHEHANFFCELAPGVSEERDH